MIKRTTNKVQNPDRTHVKILNSISQSWGQTENPQTFNQKQNSQGPQIKFKIQISNELWSKEKEPRIQNVLKILDQNIHEPQIKTEIKKPEASKAQFKIFRNYRSKTKGSRISNQEQQASKSSKHMKI